MPRSHEGIGELSVKRAAARRGRAAGALARATIVPPSVVINVRASAKPMPWPSGRRCDSNNVSTASGVDARPFVFDVDACPAVVGAHAHLDRAASVAGRVRQQDVDDLTDRADRRHRRDVLRDVDDDLPALACEDRPHVVGVLAHEVGEVEEGDDARATGAGEREQVVDGRVEARALLERGLGLFPHLRIVVLVSSSSMRSWRPVSAERS